MESNTKTRRLKVVDVAEFYAERGGGVRTYIHQKLAYAQRSGHEVVIVAPGPQDGEEARGGGRIVWVKGPPMPFDPRYYVLWNEKAVHRILDREQPDLVEGSSPWSGGWFAARWRGSAKKAFIFHQDPVAVYPQTFLGQRLGTSRVDRLFGWYWSYLRKLAAHYDSTVVAGAWLAEKLEHFAIKAPVAIPFGIARERFSPQRRDEALRSEWLEKCGIPSRDHERATLWINISRFHPEKRISTLMRGFAAARRESPNMGLVIFGDGPQREKVQRWAASTPGVVLAGFVPDPDYVARSLASADAMVHGSAAETYGLVIAEGMCSGLPIVVPNVGGAADLAGPEYAETYQPGDADDCARAMGRLLGRDRQALQSALARACDARIGTMDDHFAQLFAHYAKLVT
jgi:alpha-1,6-mannosyltransferase